LSKQGCLSDAIGGQLCGPLKHALGYALWANKVLVKFCFTKVVGERNTMHRGDSGIEEMDRKHDLDHETGC
jgi:hypothetical protein